MPRPAHFAGRSASQLLAAAAVGLSIAGLVYPILVDCAPAAAQTVQVEPDAAPGRARPMPLPKLAKAVERLLEAAYLSDSDKHDVRIYHGVWTDADLNTPERSARAALTAGDIDSLALKAPDAKPLDRAEALLLRGAYREAMTVLDAIPEGEGGASAALRSARIRAFALQALGRTDEAVRVAEAATGVYAATAVHQPDDVAEAVRLFALVTRVRGPAIAGSGGEYKAMMAALDDVRNRVDKLHWPTLLAEAELLYEKDNSADAAAALQSLLTLNPSCARAWAMLGRMSVDSFNFAMTEAIATRLDLLASGHAGAADDANIGEGDSTGGVSMWAAEIRVRAALRQSDPDAAEQALAPALARFPGARDLLALRCAVIALRYDPAALDKAVADFEALSPGSPLAVFEVGKALGEARQYEIAAKYLNLAHERQPKWAEPDIELGLMEVQYGRLDRALEALQRAASIDRFNVRADNTLKLVTELMTYESVESPHFTIRYKPGIDAILAREMIEPMERNYAIVTGSEAGGINFEPPTRTNIDLMPDHKSFGVRIAGMPAIHTIAAATGSCIAMEAPREGRDHYGTYDWVRVLRHEFVHTVTLARTNNRIPHWFTEAAAVYLELGPRDYVTCRLLSDVLAAERLFDFNQINIAFVRPERPTDRQQAYAQGHWMYEFIIQQWSPQAPLDLMDLYGKGTREEAAFQSILGISRDEFMTRFTAWAEQQVIAWGMALPEGTPSVKHLLVEEATADPAHRADVERTLSELVEEAARCALGVGGASEEPFELALPEITPEAIDGWLARYPKHPDVLELAMKEHIKETDIPEWNGRGPRPSGTKSVAEDAAPLLERYAEARPVDPLPHQLLASLYLKGSEAQRAIPHLEYMDDREQYKPVYASELARRYAAAQDWTRAGEKAERATQIAPYDAGLRELAATVAIKRSDLATAERHVSALTQLEPKAAKHTQRLEAIRKLRESTPAKPGASGTAPDR